jgi:RNA 2',3'-cyclic 3'-phosphodiesterase
MSGSFGHGSFGREAFEQGSLDFGDGTGAGGPEPAQPWWDRLFFAIKPPPELVPAILGLAESERRGWALRGRPLDPDRLHATLFAFPLRRGVPGGLLELLGRVAAEVAAPPFRVGFSHAKSYDGPKRSHAFVLHGGGAETAALAAFQAQLCSALVRHGCAPDWPMRFDPHVTLLYDNRVVSEHAVPPVSWTVEDFVLVHSLVGRTQHIECGRWPLRASAAVH